MAIRHKKTAERPDNSDPSEVQPSDWNDSHDADGYLGRIIDLAATPDTVAYVDTTGEGAALPIVAPAKAFLSGPTTTEMRAAIGAVGLDDPIFTGNPRAPTPAAGDNDTSIATTAFVQAAIAALIASSPAALDTLNELAAAIGNDPNFAATFTTALGNRLRVDVNQSLTTPQKAQGQSNLGLGTAAPLDVGTGPNNVVQLDGTGKLPALNGSQLTNLPAQAAGAGYGGTSTTSLTPTTGSRTFATQSGMAYQNGSRVRATSTSNPAVWMEGIVSAYASGSMTINVDAIGTATAKADWTFSIAGSIGAAAAQPVGTSTTSLTPSVAAKVFATQAGLAFAIGTRVRAASAATPAVWMEGPVTDYSGTSLTVAVDLIGTATAKADWHLTIAGERGAQGPQGVQGVQGGQGPQGVQGPQGAFPIGAGTLGSYYLTTNDANGPPLGGSWNQVGLGSDALWQRFA